MTPSGRKMAQQAPRYKSEVFVPIRKDSKSFEERQKTIWEDMQVLTTSALHDSYYMYMYM